MVPKLSRITKPVAGIQGNEEFKLNSHSNSVNDIAAANNFQPSPTFLNRRGKYYLSLSAQLPTHHPGWMFHVQNKKSYAVESYFRERKFTADSRKPASRNHDERIRNIRCSTIHGPVSDVARFRECHRRSRLTIIPDELLVQNAICPNCFGDGTKL